MATSWEFAYLMPHAAFLKPIENEYLALVPHSDARLAAIAQQRPAVSRLMEQFTDQFQRPIEPSALLIGADAPERVDFYAVASFRNLIALSSVIDAWSFQLSGGSAGYPLWSDYFDFYPFTATKDGDELISQSVASMEIWKPDEFTGQRSAHLRTTGFMSFGMDKNVLDGCLKQWNRRFIQNRKEWKTRVLFRSLEIASQASRMPAVGTRFPTIHDAGIGISLWVSALEILSHPRQGQANLGTVLALLKQASWHHDELKARRYSVALRGKRERVNFVCKLYAELYRARNDFLHGNSVTAGHLFPAKDRGKPILLHCAPLVYRAALTAFLTDQAVSPSQDDWAAHWKAALEASLDTSEAALLACQNGTAPNPQRTIGRKKQKSMKPGTAP